MQTGLKKLNLAPLLSATCAGLAFLSGTFAASGQEVPPAAATATYRNPVIAGDFADPSIIRVGDTYYAAGTSSEWAPYFPLYTSKDLINWEQTGHVFEKKPDWAVGSFWAPELYYRNGTFFVYYTARRKTDNVSVIGVATTDDPRKGFTDRGIIREWGSEAIDGFVFQDNDGKLYFSWKAYGLEKDRPVALMASEMTDDGLKMKGEAFELLQTNGQPISAEGQVMTRRGDWYYLIYSTKGCCGRGCDYQLEVSRAKSVKGPWEPSPHNPMLAGGGDWSCPGHGTMVTLPDQRNFFLYHAYSKKENVYTGRQGLLDEVAWSGDGWPFFPSGASPSPTAEVPFPGSKAPAGPQDFVDSFDNSTRAPQWQWDLLREPKISIAEGKLHLGVAESDPSTASPAGTFFGLRVQSGDYTLTATIDRTGTGQPGIGVYGEAKSALAVRIEGGNAVLWKVQKGQPQKLATVPLPAGDKLQLRMIARDGHRFEFGFTDGSTLWQAIGREEVDGAFIPPWDRAPRAGLVVAGKPGDIANFESVELRYSHR
ncbi:MAG: glycoside hydrolase [Akkermansiaceae bacterium]|nr:glycoside hydrolase [Akkermansiaceae bacterium]